MSSNQIMTPSELWQAFLDEEQELWDRGYDSFTSVAQAFVNKVPNPHPCAESIKCSTSRQLVYIEQNRSIFPFWRHIKPKFFLIIWVAPYDYSEFKTVSPQQSAPDIL
jgi:hypothetical protein